MLLLSRRFTCKTENNNSNNHFFGFSNLPYTKIRILSLCLDFEDIYKVDEVGKIGGFPASSADIVLLIQSPKPEKSCPSGLWSIGYSAGLMDQFRKFELISILKNKDKLSIGCKLQLFGMYIYISPISPPIFIYISY